MRDEACGGGVISPAPASRCRVGESESSGNRSISHISLGLDAISFSPQEPITGRALPLDQLNGPPV